MAFDNVWFEYNAGQPVLKGISFEAPAGSTTALVGSSGSGKSTLIGLVMAFNRPTQGRILIDGRDLAGLRLGDYREQLASVLQESFLFDGTIAENVGYARPGATRDEIVEACRIAHCDEFVSQFPQGYDTIVGERGVKLSGGQRQRVSIARAILSSPRILILDEATSSLDSESEQMIQDGLRRLRAGRTTFVIAHRLSTIRSADQILVIEAGEIVESGTHAALLAANGRRLKQWLAEIAVMGGSTGNGNVTAAAEWNIHCDPEAAWAVFTSGIPIRMVGLNITRMTGLDQADIDRLRGSGRKVAGVIAGLLEFYLANQRQRSGITIAPMHDVCAVLPYVHTGLIEYAHARVEIELRGTHTRGMTLCDLRPAALAAGPKRTPPPNALVAIRASSRDIVERVIETLLSYP